MSNQQLKSHIANHLKSLRKKEGLSLDATAKLTGVSKAMLGQIEREESSPTISTLWKIASGLGSSFSAFTDNGPNLHSDRRVFPNDPKMKVKTLFPYNVDVGFEMFEITLIENHQQTSPPHQVGVIEHIHVLNGELNVFFDGDWHLIKKGESTRFFGDQPHIYSAATKNVTFQNIVCY
jgi:XRE family transcriptional regulator, regulator of sulfur utilization